MLSHKVFLEGCTNKLRKICDEFVENAMQDDLGQKKRRRIDEQIEEAKSLMKKIDMNFHSQSEIDKLVREAKEHEKEAKKRYEEYLKSKDKE
ncbi:hypothetical protein ID0624_04370 [Helicobacter pylori]